MGFVYRHARFLQAINQQNHNPMKKYLLLFLSMLTTLWASAYDYQYNGVYYDLDNVNETATVTYASTSYGSYSGTVNIPDYITTAKGMDYDVVAIGPNAFRNSTSLTKVTIATGVESIADNAFYGCSGLTEIKIPNTVTTLGEGAFRGCSKVASVTFSSRLTSLPNYCFYGCSALKTVTLPKNLATLGTYCFQGCSSLSSVSFSTVLTNIADYCFNSCSALTSVTLPASVQNVGPYAFQNCANLDNIRLNEGLLRLGDYALANCPKLTEVTLPTTVANIGTNLFYQDRALSNAQLSASQLTTLPASTFSGCSALSIVSLPATLTTIGENAFSGCSKLPNLTFPAQVNSVASNAFNSCSNLKQLTFAEGMTTIPRVYDSYVVSVTFPNSATEIAENAFYNCTALTTITLPGNLSTIGASAFYGCGSLTTATLTKVQKISASAFYGCKALVDLRLTEGLTTIGNQAFYNCGALPSVVLPASLTTIGADAFASCTNLTDLTYAEGTRTALRTYATKLTKVTVPSTCTAFQDGIFDGCNALSQVYLSDLEVWNFLFSQRTSTPFACPRYIYLNGEMLTDLIADFGAPVANYAFANVKGLKNVTLTATVTGVGDYAFTNSTDLQNVVMGANVRTVGKSAFSGCNSLESVRLGSGVTSLGNNAFYGCTALKSMRMGGSEQSLGTSIFEGCTALESITLPATVTTIGASAFKDCKTLTAVNIPQGVSTIAASTFSGCLALPAITIPASVTSVGTSAFYGCAKLDQITLPDAVTTIGDNAFSQCVALNYATVGRGIQSIGSGAFGNCSMLKGFYCLATDVPTTNSNAFNGSDPTSIKLYVPDESASAYAAKTPWSQFADGTGAMGLSDAPVYAAEITLTPEVLILSDDYEDEDFIRATVTPANATNGKVTWQSSNTSVATVSRTGLVSPVAEGVATITCTASDKHGARATALVIIANDFQPVTALSLDHSTLTLTEGEKLQLVPTTEPATATYDVITWLTSDPNIATVNEAGEVVAVNAGTCTITAQTSDGTKLRAICALTVNAPTYASLSTYGDATGDGLVTNDDIQSLVDYLMGQHGGIDASFDINRDGNISISDITAVIDAINNNEELPAGPLKVFAVSATSYNIIVGDSRTVTTTLVPFRAGSHVSWTTSDEQLIRLSSATGDKCTFTALAPGQATITAAANDGTDFAATITVNIEPNTLGTTDGYTWVDLGLPSGTRWATCNVGATQPEEYGDYIAWGELSAKDATYDWVNYDLCEGSATSLTRYCTASANGHRDDKRVLDTADDAAAQRWSTRWTMPTAEQMAELFNTAYTTSEWITQGGVYGRKVTSRANGSSIFLPAAGYKSEYGLNSDGNGGYYATRNLADPSTKALGLNFGESTITPDNAVFRCNGQTVRPVIASCVSLSCSNLTLVVGECYDLAQLLTFSSSTRPTINWTSSDNKVASISANREVTAISEGLATLYATTAEGSTITVQLIVNRNLEIYCGIPDGVDLGLPSGTIWASRNIGASSPSARGDYFAWGETTSKSTCSWSNYKYCEGSQDTLTKYTSADGKNVLEAEDDAATVNWGESWQMPSDAQWTELRKKCEWNWTTLNSVNGYMVKGTNGNTIFLPVVGDNWTNGVQETTYGMYWAKDNIGNSNRKIANSVSFGSDFVRRGSTTEGNFYYRAVGLQVRPVMSNCNAFTMKVGECFQVSVNTSLPVTWSTSDASVVSVDANGRITAVAEGTATITVSDGGGVKTSCVITVANDIYYEDWASTNTAHSSTSSHTYSINYSAGDELSFDWEVSSESGYDYLVVTLNGSEILKKSGTDSGHYTKTFTVWGTATLVAKYTKDGSQSEGDDQGRIYNVVLTKSGNSVTPTPSLNDETLTFTAGGVTFNMKRVEHGTFQMGSTSGESDEKPVHSVTISKDYYIGETEVTQALWYAVMGQKPTSGGSQWSSSYGLGDNYPAYYISWNDCQTFITKLNQLTGQQFRMPTEAEWEFAAKGGNKSQGYTYSGSNTIGDVAWYTSNSSSKTHPVATKKPNELGIYDMSGNVWEWCSDWYSSSYYTSSAVTDPTGPTSGSYRVRRGGGWSGDATNCRTFYRGYNTPTNRDQILGVRLAL